MFNFKGREVRQFGNLKLKIDLFLGELRLYERLCLNFEIEKES